MATPASSGTAGGHDASAIFAAIAYGVEFLLAAAAVIIAVGVVVSAFHEQRVKREEAALAAAARHSRPPIYVDTEKDR